MAGTFPLRQVLLSAGILLLSALIILAGVSAFARENTTAPMLDNYLFNNGWIESAIADGEYKAGSFEASEIAARRALAKNLNDTRAIRILALVKQEQGDDAASQAWLAAGNMLGWRDSITQVKLFEYAVKRNDFSAAVDHADSLLRRRVAPDELVGVFLLAAQDPKLSKDIAAKLASDPSWRPNFFAYKQVGTAEIQTSFEGIARRLSKTNSSVTRSELTAYTEAVTAAGKASRALKFWNELFPADAAALANNASINLQWPDGDRLQSPFPTDWRFKENRKAIPLVTTDNEGRNAQLELEMSDNAVGSIATRALVLPSGSLRLELTGTKLTDGEVDSIGWSLACIDGSNRRDMEQQAGKPIWLLSVPASCTAHRLDLEVRNFRGGEKTLLLGTVKLSTSA